LFLLMLNMKACEVMVKSMHCATLETIQNYYNRLTYCERMKFYMMIYCAYTVTAEISYFCYSSFAVSSNFHFIICVTATNYCISHITFESL